MTTLFLSTTAFLEILDFFVFFFIRTLKFKNWFSQRFLPFFVFVIFAEFILIILLCTTNSELILIIKKWFIFLVYFGERNSIFGILLQ